MEETGIVLVVKGDMATVRFERAEACKTCGACKLGDDGEMLLTVHNTLGAKQGDRMSVALEETQLFAASLLAYGLPLAGLLGGLFLGSALAPLLPWVNPDATMVSCSAVFTALAFIVNRALEPRRKRGHKYLPVPLRIVEERQEEEERGK